MLKTSRQKICRGACVRRRIRRQIECGNIATGVRILVAWCYYQGSGECNDDMPCMHESEWLATGECNPIWRLPFTSKAGYGLQQVLLIEDVMFLVEFVLSRAKVGRLDHGRPFNFSSPPPLRKRPQEAGPHQVGDVGPCTQPFH